MSRHRRPPPHRRPRWAVPAGVAAAALTVAGTVGVGLAASPTIDPTPARSPLPAAEAPVSPAASIGGSSADLGPLLAPLDPGKTPGLLELPAPSASTTARAERTAAAAWTLTPSPRSTSPAPSWTPPRGTTPPPATAWTPPPPADTGVFGDGCETPGNPVRCEPDYQPPREERPPAPPPSDPVPADPGPSNPVPPAPPPPPPEAGCTPGVTPGCDDPNDDLPPVPQLGVDAELPATEGATA